MSRRAVRILKTAGSDSSGRDELVDGSRQPNTLVMVLVVVALCAGIYVRFAEIDRKICWHDEALTLLSLSGFSDSDVYHDLYDGRIRSVGDLEKYQRLNPERGLQPVLSCLIRERAVHPPGYYVLAWYAGHLSGNLLHAARLVSAVCGSLFIGALGWMAWELFGSRMAVALVVILVSVSPFFCIYSQEAREYSLLALLACLSSATLLRGLRTTGSKFWILYGVTIAAGFYVSLIMLPVVASHLLFILVKDGLKLTVPVRRFLVVGIAAILLFVPWMVAVVTNYETLARGAQWTTETVSVFYLFEHWIGGMDSTIFDLPVSSNQPLMVVPLLLVLLDLYAFYALVRWAGQRTWQFVLLFSLLPALCFVVPDLLLGGERSATVRYLVPLLIGVILALGHLFNFTFTSSSARVRTAWISMFVGTMLLSSYSSYSGWQHAVWWNKIIWKRNLKLVAAEINSSASPLILSDSTNVVDQGELLAVGHLLEPKVKVGLFAAGQLPGFPSGHSDVFVLDPQQTFLTVRTPDYNPPICDDAHVAGLWRLRPAAAGQEEHKQAQP